MKEIVLIPVDGESEFQFEDVIRIWIEKPHTILKCVSCATVAEHDGSTIRSLHPKRANKEILKEKILKTEKSVTFEEIDQKAKYTIEIENGNLKLEYSVKSEPDHPALKFSWLEEVLLPKLAKIWNEGTSKTGSVAQGFPGTLSLIDKPKYQKKYNYLKEKYGIDLVKNWPEVTDPQKFVYEDIAIASYLLVLWEDLGFKEVSFVDIGCGNGLLVYFLSREGHTGRGIDIRKRKIWSKFENTKLEERAVLPDDTFPEANWILGNHTDELTPWIPIISARSRSNFWLLPCCFFDLYSKWNNVGNSNSQYINYLHFIRSICNLGQFSTDWDAMRIPSTKRICFVGKYLENSNNDTIDDFIKNRQINKHFTPRDIEKELKSRNCQKIQKSSRDEIIKEIVQYLAQCDQTGVNFPEIIKLFKPETLKLMKNECGGIQTLLKNCKQLFVVQKNKIRIRDWSVDSADSWHPNSALYKTRLCGFIQFHPFGCLRKPENCPFAHTQDELRENVDLRPNKRRKI